MDFLFFYIFITVISRVISTNSLSATINIGWYVLSGLLNWWVYQFPLFRPKRVGRVISESYIVYVD